jgi:hypothetical protein
LTFANGEVSKTIVVTPVDDDLGEGDETIALTLEFDGVQFRSARSYSIGSPSAAAVTIADNDQQPAFFDRAVSETTTNGTVTAGNLYATHGSDNVYEAIREQDVVGSPSFKHFGLLEHRWTLNVTGGATVTFSVEAYQSASSDGDHFVFAYSTNGVDYTNMLTVTKTSDDDAPQTFAMPAGLGGTVYVRVMDTYRDWWRYSTPLDTIYIDDMFIVSAGGVAGSPSQSMAVFAAGSIAPLVPNGSSVAVAPMQSASNASRAKAVDDLFARDETVYNLLNRAAANPFAASASTAPRGGSSADRALDDLQTGLLDEEALRDIATAVI